MVLYEQTAGRNHPGDVLEEVLPTDSHIVRDHEAVKFEWAVLSTNEFEMARRDAV